MTVSILSAMISRDFHEGKDIERRDREIERAKEQRFKW
jgi:hypothetical protein